MQFRLWEVNGLFEETEVILEAKHVTRLQREKNITSGFICHDIALVQSVSHQVAVMYLGNLVELTPGHSVACHLFVPSGTENHEAHSPTGL